jgi:hypothetical protein
VSAPPPPELIARAVKLRREGQSYTAIAASCGVTKGAVAGMLYRAGTCVVSATRRPARRIKREREPKPPQPEVAAVVPRAPPPKPRVVSIAFAPGQRSCQWPTGDKRPYVWCTAARMPGGPYCLAHWRQAYRATGPMHV